MKITLLKLALLVLLLAATLLTVWGDLQHNHIILAAGCWTAGGMSALLVVER